MAGAKVTIRDQETGTERQLATTDAGSFSAPSIPVGVYSVSVSHDGFAPLRAPASICPWVRAFICTWRSQSVVRTSVSL